MGQFIKAARTDEVASGKLRSVELAGKRIALFSIGEQIYAIGDLTASANTLLDRRLSNFHPDCNARDAANSVTTIVRYNVRVAGNDVEVEV